MGRAGGISRMATNPRPNYWQDLRPNDRDFSSPNKFWRASLKKRSDLRISNPLDWGCQKHYPSPASFCPKRSFAVESSLTRLAVIGCGQMARGHVRNMLKRPERQQVVVVCEPSPEAYKAM